MMCAEAVWWRCHRRIIADYLICGGESVFHILGTGRRYRTHATHMGRRQVATKKLISGQKAQTRKRRRNAAATHKRPTTTAQAATTDKKKENLTAAATTQADLSRHALELKLSHPAPPHPGSGPAASKGKKSKEIQKPLRIGASKGEVGRVSQEGKVAQARKDSGDR